MNSKREVKVGARVVVGDLIGWITYVGLVRVEAELIDGETTVDLTGKAFMVIG